MSTFGRLDLRSGKMTFWFAKETGHSLRVPLCLQPQLNPFLFRFTASQMLQELAIQARRMEKAFEIPHKGAWSNSPPSHSATIPLIHVVNDAASLEPRMLRSKPTFSASASGCALNLAEQLTTDANSIFESDRLGWQFHNATIYHLAFTVASFNLSDSLISDSRYAK